MKLEVGMYVRDIKGRIDKIIGFKGALIEFEKDLMGGYIDENDFVKASYNIIDILEVGDMVNSLIITKISEDNETKKKYINLYGSLCEWENEDIKSVITHEQMEQMAYKVGE